MNFLISGIWVIILILIKGMNFQKHIEIEPNKSAARSCRGEVTPGGRGWGGISRAWGRERVCEAGRRGRPRGTGPGGGWGRERRRRLTGRGGGD